MSKEKYYLVQAWIPGGPDDNPHGQEFQLMMTEEEFEMGKKMEENPELNEFPDDDYYISGSFKKICKVTKEEYNKFSPFLKKTGYSGQVIDKIHYRLEDEEHGELEGRKNKHKHKKARAKKDKSPGKDAYYLVNCYAEGWEDEEMPDYEFFIMMTEEQYNAAKILEEKNTPVDDDLMFYPRKVKKLCSVTKQEYDKFSSLLQGLFSEDFLGEVEAQMESEEDEEEVKKRRKRHSMTVESEDEDDNDEEDEEEESGMVEEDDEEIPEAPTRKKRK